jgi:DedD protein
MKLMMDERLKHRLVGFAVILSIGVIFIPDMIKKSSHRLERKTRVAIKLPAKPILPIVSMPEKAEMFRRVDVAHVDIPSINSHLKPSSLLAKAVPLSKKNEARTVSKLTEASVLNALESTRTYRPTPESKLVAIRQINQWHKPTITKATSLAKSTITTQNNAKVASYSVQVATFVLQKNAKALVASLKHKGFNAYYNKSTSKNGVAFKVLVGRANQKQQAQALQQQLAVKMRLKGMVVATGGVS